MIVISYRTIKEFFNRCKDAEDALNNWYTIMEKAYFKNFNELRRVFGSCDSVGNDRYVFNIKGNKLSVNRIDSIQYPDGLYFVYRNT